MLSFSFTFLRPYTFFRYLISNFLQHYIHDISLIINIDNIELIKKTSE